MARNKTKIAHDALADFDAVAFAIEFSAWVNTGDGREQFDGAMEAVRRDVQRLKRSMEVRPELLSEAVTF